MRAEYVNISYFIFQVTDHPEQDGIKGCTIDLKTIGGESTWRLYLMSGVLIQYCIPLLIITFCHCHMAQVLWGTKTPGQAYDQRDEVILANKRKVRMYVRKGGQFMKKNSQIYFLVYIWCTY